MCNFKIYIEKICEAKERIDCQITNYLRQKADETDLVYKDNFLDEDYRMNPILSKL